MTNCEICGNPILPPNGGTVCEDCVSYYKERGPTRKGYWLVTCETYGLFLQRDGSWATLEGAARFATKEAAQTQLERIWDDPRLPTVAAWERGGELATPKELARFKLFIEPRIKEKAGVIHEADMYNANRDEWERVHDKAFVEDEREAYLRDTGFYPGPYPEKRGHRPPGSET